MLRVRKRAISRVRCATCHDALLEPVTCSRCSVVLHAECARELATCPTLGCRETFDQSEWRIAGRGVRRWFDEHPFFSAVITFGCAVIFAVTVLAASMAIITWLDPMELDGPASPVPQMEQELSDDWESR